MSKHRWSIQDYTSLFDGAAKIVLQTKLIWIASIAVVLISLFPDPREGKTVELRLLLLCLALPLSIASILAHIGLIEIIYRKHSGESIDTSSVMAKIKYSIGPIILFSILGALITMPFLACYLVLYVYGLRNMSYETSIFALQIPAFISLLLSFGYQGIIIHGLRPIASLKHTILVTTNNFWRLLSLSITLQIIGFLLTGKPVVLFFGVKAGLSLSQAAFVLLFGSPGLTEIFAVRLLWTVGSLLLVPLQSAVLTLAYLRFTSEIEYPALSKPPLPSQTS